MTRKPSEIENILQSKFGFASSRSHSSDHRWYELSLPDLPTITTKVSHSKDEIGDTLMKLMAHQCQVRLPYFKGMLKCDEGPEDYRQQIRRDPYPGWEHIGR